MTVTTAQHITVLKHLANGRDTDWVATVTKLPQAVVERFADEAGWPDPDRLVSAIEALNKSTSAIPERVDHTASPVATAKPTPAPRPDLSVARQPAVTGPQPPVLDDLQTLLLTAHQSTKKRTQALGAKVADAVKNLRAVLEAEREEVQAAKKAAAERERNAARIAELKAELARLQGKPSPTKRATTSTSSAPGSDEPTAAQVRKWAADKGVDCPAVGRVPGSVRKAYDDAHAKHDAA